MFDQFAFHFRLVGLNFEKANFFIFLFGASFIFLLLGLIIVHMDKTVKAISAQGGASSSSSASSEDDERTRLERKRIAAEQDALRDLKSLLMRFCYRYGCNGNKDNVCGNYCPGGKEELEIQKIVEKLAEESLNIKRGDPIEHWKTLSRFSLFASRVYPKEMTKHLFYHILNR